MGNVGVKGGAGAGVATSDAQYMQQQSQIFVFTTHLANKAAEAVMQGSFNTIIAFHCAQPGTKKLLEVRRRPVRALRPRAPAVLEPLSRARRVMVRS